MARRRVVSRTAIQGWRSRYCYVNELTGLSGCTFVIETVKEDLALKRGIYAELEEILPASAVIASNTSSLPISSLQEGRKHPGRFIGAHWGEPVQVMRYLEIIPGAQTHRRTVLATRRLGEACGKEPTQLKQDIRGFLSNRMMYAMMREAFHLVEHGVATLEDVDRSFRNDIGWWASIAGPFRWMDLTGIPAYGAVMEGLLPELCISSEVPPLMKKMLARKAEGVGNCKGFYRYDERSARKWERAWVDFTYDLRALLEKHNRRIK
jgi:3-hydroxybutyryl-CoA dehydrogenase